MSASQYLEKASEALRKLAETQKEPIGRAAGLMVDAVLAKKALFSFGASHSFIMTEEMVYRSGGLVLMNPIYPQGMNLFVRPMTLTSKLERVPGLGKELLAHAPIREGDVLIITSTSGRNAVVIDMAAAALERKIKLIGITSLAYSSSVASRHASGRKLVDFCDVVIDNGAPHGDAAVEIPGFPQKVGPLSSVTGCSIANALVSEVAVRLAEKGIPPPVFASGNMEDGDRHNMAMLETYRDRIHYMD